MYSFIDFSFVQEDDEDDEDLFIRSLGVDKEKALKEYREIMNSEKIKYWR